MKRRDSNFMAFDIGSSKIAAISSNISKVGDIKINSQILQYSEGFKSSVITNMDLAEQSIIAAIYALEQKSNYSIKEVAISLSGIGVKSYYINYKISINHQPIKKEDVQKLISTALSRFTVDNHDIIHYFPLEFIINDTQQVEDPIGIYARGLSCYLHIVSADRMMLMNLTKCLAKCYVEVSDIFISVYASGLSCLTEDDKELGSIVIDLGSNTSSFGIFLNNKFLYTGHIPMGSQDITYEIAQTFSISLSAADKLKILYGNADPKLVHNSIIRLDDIDPNNHYNSEILIAVIDLANIISIKVRQIFSMIKEEYDRISMHHILARRMVITGGGACLPGLTSIASEVFQIQVRIAKPRSIVGFVDYYNPYMYSTVLGMVQAKSLHYKKRFLKYGAEEDVSLIKQMFLWLKENI